MSEKSFRAEIRTPDRCHFSGPVDVVRVATELGQIEIFSDHAPLVGTVPYSRVQVRHEDHEEEYLVRNGLVFMDPATNNCRVLVQHCERKDDVDYTTAKEYLEVIRKQLETPENLSSFQLAYLEDESMALTSAIEDMPVDANKKENV